MDESGFTLWTAPKRGRAPSGETPNIAVSSQQGRNQSLVMAISATSGIVLFCICDCSFDSASFINFFQEWQRLISSLPSTVWILGNCAIHKRDELIGLVNNGHEIRFLPPYSPFFNPIENCFNVIKQSVRGALVSEPIIQRIRAVDSAPWGTKMETRRQILVEVITSAVSQIGVEKVVAFKNQTLHYIPKVLNMEEL